MQALSAARRYSWGLAKRFVPQSSTGSSTGIVKSFWIFAPPIAQLVTCVSERVPPFQDVATRHEVLPFLGSAATAPAVFFNASRSIPFRMRRDEAGVLCELV